MVEDSTSSKLSTSKKILLALENGSRIPGSSFSNDYYINLSKAVKPRKTSDVHQSLQNSFNENDSIFEQSCESPSKKNLKSFFRRKSCECTECGGISKLEKSIQGYPQFSIPLPDRKPALKLPIEDEATQTREARPRKNRKLIKLSSFKTPLSIKPLGFKSKNKSRDSSPKLHLNSPTSKSQVESKKFLIIPHALARKGNTKRSPPSIEEDFKNPTPLLTLDEDIAQETGQIYKMLSGKIIEESNESVNATPKTQRFSKISKIDLLRSPLNTTMLDTHSGIWKLKDSDLNTSPLHSKHDQAAKKMSIDGHLQRKSQIKKVYGLHESPKEPQRKVKIQSFSHFNLMGSQLPKVLLSPKQDKPKTCRIPTSSLESISPLFGPKRNSKVSPKLMRLSQQAEGSYPTISSEEFSPSLPGIHTCRSPRLQDSSVSKIKQASKKEVLLQIYNQKVINKTK